MKIMENFSKDIETTKDESWNWQKKIFKLSQIKILLERHNSTLDSAEGRISELKHMSEKVSKLKHKAREEKRLGRKNTRASEIYEN